MGFSTFAPPPLTRVELGINVCGYVLVGLCALLHFRVDLHRIASFPRLVFFATLFRLVWLFATLFLEEDDVNDCTSNTAWMIRRVVLFSGEVAQLVFFMAFSTLFFFCWEILRAAKPSNRFKWINPYLIQVLLQFWTLVLWVALFAYRLHERECGAELENASEVLIMSALYAGLSIGFLVVCVVLVQLLNTKVSISSSRLRSKIMVIGTCCVPLFLLKAFVLMGSNENLYPWCYFTLPEALPALVILYGMRKKTRPTLSLEDAALLSPPREDVLVI